jgi:hypothetical protein
LGGIDGETSSSNFITKTWLFAAVNLFPSG